MGRNKKFSDIIIRNIKYRIDKKEISLRGASRELDVSPEGLRKMIIKLPFKPPNEKPKKIIEMTKDEIHNQANEIYKAFDESKENDFKLNNRLGLFEKSDIKHEIYIDSDTLRAINKFVYGGSTREKRENLLDKFISEFERQKGLLK